MDRNSILGFLLIAAVLLGFYFINKPNEQELAEKQRISDSTFVVQDSIRKQAIVQAAIADTGTQIQSISDTSSFQEAVVLNVPAEFEKFTEGSDDFIVLESNWLKVKIAPKGGRVVYAELKEYTTYEGAPLILFDEGDQEFGYKFSASNKIVNTSDLYFEVDQNATAMSTEAGSTVSMKMKLNEHQYIEHKFSLVDDSYMLDFQINLVGFDQVIPRTIKYIDLNWNTKTLFLERKAKKNSRIVGSNPTVYYRYENEKPGRLNDTKDGSENLDGKVQWVAFKQHFFNQTLISKTNFLRGHIESETIEDEKHQKRLDATLSFAFEHIPVQTYDLNFFYGPNHYKTLKAYNLEMEEQIFLGRNILRWVNVGVVIPVFNFLSKYIANYGIIILLLTLIIKMILLPLTYKSYLSTAKMRLLKPELDILKEKVGKDQAKMQQEQMKLYRQAGVSPMGGCLPMLLQMPILIALFRFFPSSIELRQESFLWAHDLSTYDSIWTFGYVPLLDKIYGDHVSLFTVLMTISTLIYTRMNSQMMGGGNDAMGKQMKIIQYVMPIMFLGFFNNYSAGLSYYYFLANIITFGQQYLFKQFVNEDKLRKKIEMNKKKKTGKGKSKWQQRLEDMQKQQRQANQKKR
ncbi:MAG: membrane protein insertase YidC [Bacteroidetes bacterium]|nr:membrane protein insertase YidC [Bacteroidota bacterium]